MRVGHYALVSLWAGRTDVCIQSAATRGLSVAFLLGTGTANRWGFVSFHFSHTNLSAVKGGCFV